MNIRLFTCLGYLISLSGTSLNTFAADASQHSQNPIARQATAADINRTFELLEQEALAEERLKQAPSQNKSSATPPQELGTEIELVARHKKIIRNVIAANWTSMFNGGVERPVIIHMRLAPNGTIISSAVGQSSGVPLFDSSVLQAVEKTGRFQELKDLPIDVYERNFSELDLLLQLEDLLP